MQVLANSMKGDSADFIQGIMKGILEQQLTHQKNGNYKDAQTCRLQFEDSRKKLQKRRLQEMEASHKKESQDIQKAHNEELSNFNKFWDDKLIDYHTEGDRLSNQLTVKHSTEIQKIKDDLNIKLTPEVKESSELLNLRKMEAHMAKQKNYVEAEKVQAKANKMEQEEKGIWIQNRNLKIETAVGNLKVRQGNEMMIHNKRVSAGHDQQNRDRQVEELRLKQKYDNVCKEVKSQHEKEILLFKGEFRSKGGNSGNGSPSKSKR